MHFQLPETCIKAKRSMLLVGLQWQKEKKRMKSTQCRPSNPRPFSLFLWFVIMCLSQIAGVQTILHSRFLQPGNGLIKEIWYRAPDLTLDTFRQLSDFPTCPHSIQNLDDFNDPPAYISDKQKYTVVRYKAYFVPSETGNHRFYAKCKGMCSFEIEMEPSEAQKILQVHYATSTSCWECSATQMSRNIFLFKSVRYFITLMRIGDGNYDFAALGVKRPSGTYERPIRKTSLWRTLSLYYWHGLFGEYYQISTGTRPDLGSIPAQPTEVGCLSRTFDDRKQNNFGLRVSGFFHPQTTDVYKVNLQCQNRCEFYSTINGTEVKVAEQDDVSILKVIGKLEKRQEYFLRINYYKDDKGGTKFYVKRMSERTMFDFFKSSETRTIKPEMEIIPALSYQATNSTSVNITWGVPQIPIYNNFTLKSYEISFWPLDNPSNVHKSKIADTAVNSKLFSGLGVWSIHEAKFLFIGEEYTIKPKDLIFRTGEGVPTAPPSRILLRSETSTSIVVAWGPISFHNQHGVMTGFLVKYSPKGENSWLNVTSHTIAVREITLTGLKFYHEYEIRVAGMTSAGVGVFSSVFTERTQEDAPSSAPTDVIAYNLSSRALEVKWGPVPFEGRNGIVRVYVIYYKQKDAPESDWTYEKASGSVNTSIITGLKHWSFYQIKVAAKTVKEGVQSEAVVTRTDQFVPSQPPPNVTVTAVGPRSVNVSWGRIPYEYTNGIILQYLVTYKETEGYARWLDVYSTKLSVLVAGLEEHFHYTIRVAGVTVKGSGALSPRIYVKTKQDVSSTPVEAIQATNTSANSLLVSWQQIPYRHRNGDILGYRVGYKANDTAEWKYTTTDRQHMHIEIHGLNNYTWYEIRVAGITKIGVGKFNTPVLGITGENVPSAPPSSFTGRNSTSRSIVFFWDPIPLKHRNGIITGFRVMYREDGANDWEETVFSSESSNGSVYGLKIFQPYIFRIAGMTSKGTGVYSNPIRVWTDEDSPEGYPMKISGNVSSSTAVFLTWNSEQSNDTNGIILAYYVFYQVIKCPVDRPPWCLESQVAKIKTRNNNTHFLLTGLKKFIEYDVWIRVLNKIGTGPPSPRLRIWTAEDIPVEPPPLLESFSRDMNSISLYWDPIKESARQGILVGYRIFYRRQDKEILRTHRVVRAAGSYHSNSTVEGLLAGESYIDVKGNTTTGVITNLEPYRWYIVRVAGMTINGIGPVSVINASCGQSLAIAAPRLDIQDKYSYTEISIRWTSIASFNLTRGTVLEYNIRFWPFESEMNLVYEPKVTSLTIKAPMTSAKLSGLKPFTKYAIQLAAVTQTGIGVYTDMHYGETCRCEKKIHIVKRILAPMITKDKNDKFSSLLDEAIKECCSTCSSVTTETKWEIDSHGEGALSAEDIFDELQHGKEVYAPQLQAIHTWSHLDPANGIGKFVPVIRSPGVVVIVKRTDAVERANEGAKILISGLTRAYPVCILAFLILILFGHYYWLIEKGTKESDFADGFFRGCYRAVWFAFQSQSTVGYGDILPSTFMGRIGTVVSIIFGLIWRILLIASITVAALQKMADDRGILTFAGKKVSVTNGTFQFAFKKGATISHVFGYKEYRMAVEKVLDGSVDMAIVEGLSIIGNYSIMNSDKLIIKDIVDDKQFYGVVFSGKAERLATCANIYMRSNKKEIDRQMQINFHRLWKALKSGAENERVPCLLNTDSTVFRVAIIVLPGLLAFAAICSLIYEWRRRKKLLMRIGPLMTTKANEGDDELMKKVEQFIESIYETAEELELKHAKERIELSRKNYAVNIVPDVIALFGDADYVDRKRNRRQSIDDYNEWAALPRSQADHEDEGDVAVTKKGTGRIESHRGKRNAIIS